MRIGHQLLIGDAVVDGGPGLLLIVEKFPWANTLQVTEGVEEVLAQIQPGMTDVRIDATIFRPATFIETSIDNLTNALLLGILLVILVLMAFLYEWRTALISVVAIPLSLVAAGLVLYHQGSTINTMVLAGFVISVGVVVDDAIIDVENIWRRLTAGQSDGRPDADGQDRARCVHRGPQGDRLRNADQRRGHHAGVLPGGLVRSVLPTARHVVRTGTPGVDGRRPHGDAGARPAPAAQARPHPARVPAQGPPGPVVLRGAADGSRAPHDLRTSRWRDSHCSRSQARPSSDSRSCRSSRNATS